MRRVVAVVLLIAVAAAGAIVANLALLDYASRANDPVGKLTPRADLPPAPAGVVRPQTGTIEHDDHDD